MQYEPLTSADTQQRAKELPWNNLVPFLLLLGAIVVGIQNKEPGVLPKSHSEHRL